MNTLEQRSVSSSGPRGDEYIGRQIDNRYTVLSLIGRGGVGRVYKALQLPLNRLVALKILAPMFSKKTDPSFAKRFFLEASVTARLSHSNTIRVFDFGRTEDGIFFLAMEYIDGLPLSRYLASHGALPWDRTIRIAMQIARSLREAHRFGVIHRDLKASNVMLLNEEKEDGIFIKVLDFGLVKFFSKSNTSFISDSSSVDPLNYPDYPDSPDNPELTEIGVFMGSPAYVAPEQAMGLPIDPRADIYSLGVLFWQMLVGKLPFSGRSVVDILARNLHEIPQAPSQAMPSQWIPNELDDIVLKMIKKKPDDRMQTMEEVLDALRNLMVSQGSLSATSLEHELSSIPSKLAGNPEEFEKELSPWAKRHYLAVGVGIVFAVAIGLLLWTLIPSPPPTAPEENTSSTRPLPPSTKTAQSLRPHPTPDTTKAPTSVQASSRADPDISSASTAQEPNAKARVDRSEHNPPPSSRKRVRTAPSRRKSSFSTPKKKKTQFPPNYPRGYKLDPYAE